MQKKPYQKGSDVKLSEHFHLKEFDCRCTRPQCQTTLVDTDLIITLEKIRRQANYPITILSGYRCKKRNEEIGGSASSRHMYGDAADITCPLRPLDLAAIARRMPLIENGGLGLYDTFIHVDTRGVRARWNHRSGTQGAAAFAKRSSTKTPS